MTRRQAKIYIFGGLIVAGMGFVFSGPSVYGFWMWLALPGILILRGIVHLLMRRN